MHFPAWLGQIWQEEHKGSCASSAAEYRAQETDYCNDSYGDTRMASVRQPTIPSSRTMTFAEWWSQPISISFSYSWFIQEGWALGGCASLGQVTKSSSAAFLCITSLKIRNYGFSSALLSSLPHGEDVQQVLWCMLPLLCMCKAASYLQLHLCLELKLAQSQVWMRWIKQTERSGLSRGLTTVLQSSSHISSYQ